MIQFLCPGCQQSFTVDNSRANSIGTCPKCSSRFYVPESPDAPAPPPPLPVRKSPTPAEPVTLKRHRYEDDEPRRNSRKRTDDWDDDEEDDEEDDEPVRRTKRRRKKKKSHGIFEDGNSFSTFLLGYVGISILLIAVSSAIPQVIFLPLVIGWLVGTGAGIWFTVLTFQDSLEAGLLCLFLPFYALYYLITNFDYVSKSFYLSLISSLMMFVSLIVTLMHFKLD